MSRDWRPRSLAAQGGTGVADPATGAVIPPIHPASTFERAADASYPTGFSYARDTNPTFLPAERLLARLEGGEGALLFGSGMAAATAAILALPPGSGILAPQVMYWGLRRWLAQHATALGYRVRFVPTGDLAALERALAAGDVALVWIETPANPLWTVTDIAAAARLAHAAGARLAVDSTVATPVLTRPLELGADLVMHSATKALNGHSDLIAGALVTARADAAWSAIRTIRQELGAVLGSFEAWLLLRGLRTLYVRQAAQIASAAMIAERLARHPRVVEVLYPGLPSHPGHEVAAAQMHLPDGRPAFGSLLSLRVEGGRDAALQVAARLQLWVRATSLGGVESLVEHRASIEGADSPVPQDLLRLSVGLEDPEDLIADLEHALGA